MRSAIPQDSVKVSSRTPSKNMWQNLAISRSPTLRSAALVFPPRPTPSTNPAPRAMTFLRAPQTSAPATSEMCWTRKWGGLSKRSLVISSAGGPKFEARVDSHIWPSATSEATLAPMRTPQGKSLPMASEIPLEMRTGDPVFSQKSIPLMRLTPRQDGWEASRIVGSNLGRNWWGRTKMRRVASLQASARSATARTFSGSLIPGRYLTFSCSSLMTSVSLRSVLPPNATVSSKTHMLTLVS
mmetsp:Transcript_20704/g.43307  ORF Transcript_20704/g.43307 Transcript_20704/m.43307 type:complete len:241 (-) Transcript_20704:251-973(-)